MSKIEIRKTCIIIHNYEPGDCEFIEHKFSIYDKLYHKYFMKGMYWDPDTKDLYLPAGIDFYYITRNFGDDIWNKVKADKFMELNQSVKLKYAPRDEVQKKAIKFCLGIDEYMNNRNSSQISVNLNTGKGKTYVAIAVMAYYNIRTIMITSSIDWIDQWREKIKEYTNIKDDEIYTIAGSSSIAKLVNGMKNLSTIKFFLCSHDTIRSFATKYGWENVHKLFRGLKIGIKIYDEAHLYFDNICMIDFYTDVWKTYYLTASPMRSDRFEDYIYQEAFRTVPKIDLYDEQNDPHTEYIAIKFNSHPTPKDISRCQNPYGFDRIRYTDYLITRPNYYRILQIIMNIILSTTSYEGKSLIYIGTNKAILVTYNWLKYYYPGISIGLFSSLVPKSDKRNQLNNKIILTTTKSAGAALDIPGLEITVILNEPFKSKVLAQQTLGRTRDRNTRYIDVVDIGFRTLNYYYNQKKPVFKKYATSCKEMSFSDYTLDYQIQELEAQQQEQKDPNRELKEVVVIIPKEKREEYAKKQQFTS